MTNNPEPLDFAAALTDAIRDRGLSLDRIRARLEAAGVPVSNATLSYWQSGRSLPRRSRSIRTLIELESILELESGTLLDLLHAVDGRLLRQVIDWPNVVPAGEHVEQILEELDLSGTGRFTRISIHDTLTLDANGFETNHVTSQIVRAERSGVQSFPIIYQQYGEDAACPEVEALLGCSLGRVVTSPENALIVAELVLPRPMQRNELFLVEWGLALNPVPCTRLDRSTTNQTQTIALAVQFHPSATPKCAEATFSPTFAEAGSEPIETKPLPVLNSEIQSIVLDAAPGVYSLVWGEEL